MGVGKLVMRTSGGRDKSSKLGSETVLVFGPESVSYERSRHENWTILREISARVLFWKNHQNQEKSYFQYFQDIRKIEKNDFQYFQASKI